MDGNHQIMKAIDLVTSLEKSKTNNYHKMKRLMNL